MANTSGTEMIEALPSSQAKREKLAAESLSTGRKRRELASRREDNSLGRGPG
jgi:hypothetical protein